MEEAFLAAAGEQDSGDAERPEVDIGDTQPWPLEDGLFAEVGEPRVIPAAQFAPAKTWRLFKGVVYFVAVLSALDALGNIAAIIAFGWYGNWAAFIVAVSFMSIVSCITAVGAAVGDHGAHGGADTVAERGIFDSDAGKRGAAAAFCKVGGLRIAHRALQFLSRAEIMAAAGSWQDEDLCEHLLPLFMFTMSSAMAESWPLLIMKCFVLGRNHGTTGGEGSIMSHPLLALSVALSIALLAVIPVFVDKISCDLREVYVRVNSSTALGTRFLTGPRLAVMFCFRYAEGLSWWGGLVLFAWSFKGWFWMFWGAETLVLSVLHCLTADTSEDEWEVGLLLKIVLQVFFTAPQHSMDQDVVIFFRARSPSRVFTDPSYFPLALHFGWRLATQALVLLCIYTAGRHNWLSSDEWLDIVPWLHGMMALLAGLVVSVPLVCRLMPSPDQIVDSISERRYLLLSRRPDYISSELYQAVLDQAVHRYTDVTAGCDFETRAWVLREHAMRNQSNRHGDRFQMSLSRERLVETVLDSVHGATQTQLRRGPRVDFGVDEVGAEIGDDQGGMTREMFAEIARRGACSSVFTRAMTPPHGSAVQPLRTMMQPIAAANPQDGEDQARLLTVTAGNRVRPVPCPEHEHAAADVLRRFQDFGRVCGMALWTNELLDVSFALSFLKRVLEPDRDVDMAENLADLAQEDHSLWQSLTGMLKAADNADCEPVDFGVQFERTVGDIETGRDEVAQVVPLVEGGSDIAVTSANAKLFVAKYLEDMLSTSIIAQANAFRSGLLDVLEDARLLNMFDASELQNLLGGTEAINAQALERWRRDATLGDEVNGNEDVIVYFWSGLEVMSEAERAQVLAFTTGCPRMPVGSQGPEFVVNLHPHEDPNALPTSHTCTNTINLPPYPSQDSLVERLRMVLAWRHGFGLA